MEEVTKETLGSLCYHKQLLYPWKQLHGDTHCHFNVQFDPTYVIICPFFSLDSVYVEISFYLLLSGKLHTQE